MGKIGGWGVYCYMRLVLVLVVLLVADLVISESAFAQRRPTGAGAYSAGLEAARNPNPSALRVARLQYGGGGDWYWGNSAIPNFLKFVRDETALPVDTLEYQVEITDAELFNYPFLFATGHGVMRFTAEERERLREYLRAGGFLFVNDSYGMAATFLDEMQELFPERPIVDLPFDHELYRSYFDFPNGPPKIHEHDGAAPRGRALIVDGRVVVYFLTESDIGDGWEDEQVHGNPPEKRLEAFRMGTNILTYALLY